MRNMGISDDLRFKSIQISSRTIKQKMFTFKIEQLQFQNPITQGINRNTIKFNSFSNRTKNTIQPSLWKPKIKSKRMFEDPKFLVSLQRKKIRIINGINSHRIEPQTSFSNRSKCFQGEKIKGIHKVSQNHRTINQSFLSQKLSEGKFDTLDQKSQSKFKPVKSPHLNFNLHHILKKRKTFKLVDQSRIMGSNLPYYQYFFEKDETATNHGKESRRSNINQREAKTADYLNTIAK